MKSILEFLGEKHDKRMVKQIAAEFQISIGTLQANGSGASKRRDKMGRKRKSK